MLLAEHWAHSHARRGPIVSSVTEGSLVANTFWVLDPASALWDYLSRGDYSDFKISRAL